MLCGNRFNVGFGQTVSITRIYVRNNRAHRYEELQQRTVVISVGRTSTLPFPSHSSSPHSIGDFIDSSFTCSSFMRPQLNRKTYGMTEDSQFFSWEEMMSRLPCLAAEIHIFTTSCTLMADMRHIPVKAQSQSQFLSQAQYGRRRNRNRSHGVLH